MKTLISLGVNPNFLVPGWIGVFGFAALSAPPLGAAASLLLVTMGVVVVPALVVLAASALGWRAGHAR